MSRHSITLTRDTAFSRLLSHEIANMSTYETAETKFITVNGVKYAYRLFGTSSGIPLVMQIHFRGNMDWWDPAFINPLAAKRPILFIDNAGVGRSEGTVPESFLGWAK